MPVVVDPRTIQPTEIKAFYEGAAEALRALDARSTRARRFGPELDATWRNFRGDLAALTDGDRLDLLVRDAATAYPVSFSPRVIFSLEGLAADEPFGRDWPGLDAITASRLLRDDRGGSSPPLAAVLGAVAKHWGQRLGPVAAALASVRPADRLVVSGAGAIVAVAERFDGDATLDVADQILLVAGSPCERQLLGIAAALLGTTRPLCLLAPGATVQDAEAMGFGRIHRSVISGDAAAAARETASALVSHD